MRGYAKISNNVFVGDGEEGVEGERGVEVEQPIMSSRRILFIVLLLSSLFSGELLLVGAMSLTSRQGSSSSNTKTKRTSCVGVCV